LVSLSSHVNKPAIDQSSVITTANSADDVSQILYGLSIRGVRAKAVEIRSKDADLFAIVLESPTLIQRRIANDSIDGIWDAILDEYPRAVTLDGHCYFCQYDVASLPKPTICPE